jgi:negative regulator of sigma E activity
MQDQSMVPEMSSRPGSRAEMSGPERHEQLSAYFDDELEDSMRALVEAELERDEELAAKLADLSFMREMVVGDLEHQAERVPEARFEQIWDSFEQTLERESRLQEAAEEPPTVWQRLIAWARPLRMPIAAVSAAGVLVFVFARSAGAPSEQDDETVASNTQDEAASDAEPSTRAPQPASPRSPGVEVAPEPEPDRVALAPEPSPQVDPEMFPQPEPGEAEIRRIEFGGQTGTISQVEGARGTTTVIWVTEEDAPADSERSL